MTIDHRQSWQAQSLLLGYPDETLIEQLDLLGRVAVAAPPSIGLPMAEFIDHARKTPPTVLTADYVATFDHRKRCCLYLTYYAYGDTRKRGMALLKLKQTYAEAGMQLVDDELPDHLSVALEYAAAHPDPAVGAALLNEHRAGIELLRLSLQDAGSPWNHVLESISATLPPLRGSEREAVARLAAEGPPEEHVGLAPFGPPEYMPATRGAHR